MALVGNVNKISAAIIRPVYITKFFWIFESLKLKSDWVLLGTDPSHGVMHLPATCSALMLAVAIVLLTMATGQI